MTSATHTVAREEISGLFDGAAKSVFRLETLQHYDAAVDNDRFRAFTATGQLPPPGSVKLATIRLIRDAAAHGVAWSRVHIVEQPLTPYLRFELAAYVENRDAGEDIWIAERTADPGLADLVEDFALIDERAVLFYRYDEGGRVVSWELADDPEVIERCRYQRDLARAHAVRLADYQLPTT